MTDAERSAMDRVFREGQRVRHLCGQRATLIDEDLADEGEDAKRRVHVARGTLGTIVQVRDYPSPLPYVVLWDDDEETSVPEHDLETIGG